jgi:LacI family transcriptional regulator
MFKQIAILVEVDDTWGRSVIQGIADYAQTVGNWRLLIDPRNRWGHLCVPEGGEVHGVIARLKSRAMADHVRAANVATVDVDLITMSGETWAGRVCTDDVERARLALEHLRDCAFRRFAHFTPHRRGHSTLRGESFEAAVRAAGFHCDVYRSPYPARHKINRNEEQRSISRWLARLKKPVAVFTADTHCGRRLADICLADGIAIPDELAIIAGDTDKLMCNVSPPSLSSVLLASWQIGYEAGKLLTKLMSRRRVPKKPILIRPLGVITRQSTDVLAIDDQDMVVAIRFIRERAVHGIRVDDVLRQVPLSRRALEMNFRKILGRSPAEEIRRVRIEKAKYLLSHSDMSMDRVAAASGFSSATRFGVVFREKLGLAPLAYRKQSRWQAAE